MITGYRRYQIVQDGLYFPRISPTSLEPQTPYPNRYILKGAQAIWEDREFQATCNYQYRRRETELITLSETEEQVCEEHLKNDMNCTCGIYVLKGPDIKHDYSQWPALVAVTGWGAFVEYEFGWRIQYTRMEHIWVEPNWATEYLESMDIPGYTKELLVGTMLQQLSGRYKVPTEIRKAAICCGEDHEMVYWPSAEGPLLLCQMQTSHIVNCLRYLERAAKRDRSSAGWKRTFEKEIDRRSARMGENGKIKVIF